MYLSTSIFSSSGRHFKILKSRFINIEATCILYISFVYLLVIKNGEACVDSMLSDKFNNFSFSFNNTFFS